MCLAPITLKNSKELWCNNGHGSTRIVPCGKCPECLASRSASWAFRLSQELKKSSYSAMVTLTYEQEPLSFNKHPTLYPKDLTKFWKDYRNKYPNSKLKYYAIGEYGTQNLRPHYHAIMFNIHKNVQQRPTILQDIWQKGQIDIVPVTPASIRYVTNYIMQGTWRPERDDDDRHKHFSRMSKGLGKCYLSPAVTSYHKINPTGLITLNGGIKQTMPRYYKEKLYTPLERATISYNAQKELSENWHEFEQIDFNMKLQQRADKIRKFNKYESLKKKSKTL